MGMIVNGFFEPFTRELPMEYAVELNRPRIGDGGCNWMMQYPQITIPPRSTLAILPGRVHPTKVEEMPKADPIKFSHGEEFELPDSEEIARHSFTQLHLFVENSSQQ